MSNDIDNVSPGELQKAPESVAEMEHAWVPLIAGLLVGLMVFAASESERCAYLSRIEQGKAK